MQIITYKDPDYNIIMQIVTGVCVCVCEREREREREKPVKANYNI